MNYIYCYTNEINQHKYVGQTNNVQRRQNEHRSVSFNLNDSSYNYLFHKKIREYGIDNFTFEILEEVQDIKEVDIKEEFWIKEKQSYIKFGKGYNLTLGGVQSKIESRFLLEEIIEIKKMIISGYSYFEISDKFNICFSSISNINNGISFREENEIYPLYKYYKNNEDYSELIDLLLSSALTLKEIAEKLSIGYSTVKKINAGTLRKNLYPSYPIRKENIAKQKSNVIIKMLLQNFQDVDILKEVKTSKETIRRINLGITHKDESLNYPLRNL